MCVSQQLLQAVLLPLPAAPVVAARLVVEKLRKQLGHPRAALIAKIMALGSARAHNHQATVHPAAPGLVAHVCPLDRAAARSQLVPFDSRYYRSLSPLAAPLCRTLQPLYSSRSLPPVYRLRRRRRSSPFPLSASGMGARFTQLVSVYAPVFATNLFLHMHLAAESDTRNPLQLSVAGRHVPLDQPCSVSVLCTMCSVC